MYVCEWRLGDELGLTRCGCGTDGHDQVCAALIKAGADVNAVNGSIGT